MDHCCSFCFKSVKDVKTLVGGTGVYICDGCVKVSQDIIDSKSPNKYLAPYEGQDTEKLLSHLPKAETVSKQAHKTVYHTVDLLRQRKVSWQKIGDALGVSRQAAWERFS